MPDFRVTEIIISDGSILHSRNDDMKKKLVLILIFSVFGIRVQAQNVGPLQQVMSANTLIDRPMEFRDLHDDLASKLTNQKPGAQMDVVSTYLSEFHTKFIQLINTVGAKHERSEIRFCFDGRPFLQLTDAEVKSPKDLCDVLEKKTSETLEGLLRKIPIGDGDMRREILGALISALRKSGLTTGGRAINCADNNEASLSNLLAAMMLYRFEIEMKNVLPETAAFFMPGTTTADTIVFAFNSMAGWMRNQIAEHMQYAEMDLMRALGELNAVFLSGNTGLGIAEGVGEFSGGIFCTLARNKHLLLGFYLSGLIGRDSSSVSSNPRSLVGIQARYATDATQIDLLYAKLMGENKAGVHEIGLGISFRLIKDVIIGVAGYALLQFEDSRLLNDRTMNTVGFTLKSAGVSSPSLLLGVLFQTGKSALPIVQVGFPIPAVN